MDDAEKEQGPKKGAVTTFKLTPELSAMLDVLKDRDECTKDAIIRRMIQWGIEVDSALQKMKCKATRQVAMKKYKPKIMDMDRTRRVNP